MVKSLSGIFLQLIIELQTALKSLETQEVEMMKISETLLAEKIMKKLKTLLK